MTTKIVVSLKIIYEDDSSIIQQVGRNLWINGKEARLSPQEMQLFNYLVAQPNRTITQAELKSMLYPTGKKVDPKIIAILVSKLRRKLGSAAYLLETIHRIGFRWSDT